MSVETLKARRSGTTLHRRTPTKLTKHALPVFLAIYLIAIFVPFQLSIGPVVLSASRAILLFLLPFLMRLLLVGSAGKIILSDILFALYCVWIVLSMTENHGFIASIEYIGIATIETMGAYLLGRCLIRDADTFERMVRFMFGVILVLIPFSLFETITGHNLLLQISNTIIPSQPEVPPLRRMGLERVQATLDHPIHFGIIIGAMVSLTYAVIGHGRSLLFRLSVTAMVFLTGFLSLSSGALAMMSAQVMLLAYDGLFKRLAERWQVFLWFVIAVALFEYLTGTILQFVIQDFAYNPQTAFNRTRILGYGIQNIQSSPLYGIGLNEWTNLPGMSDSVDMFWLLMTMTHGIPAGALVFLGFIWLPLTLVPLRMPTARIRTYKTGWLISMCGIFVALWGVHVWREAYVFLMFLLGSGSWMLQAATPSYNLYPTNQPRRVYRRMPEKISAVERTQHAASERDIPR
ncbi:hypothetical protein [uncultured Tateyamaria sp.]|uniref:O-antigen ligase family protein n=1 Tax=uncultured Tateyamaria sp. TaxID=455651 RepID=UPI002631D6EC|nr:hypothetical protein [uncultured Tateyamaria sp.]